MAATHHENLTTVCRLCGNLLSDIIYEAYMHRQDIKKAFFIDLELDTESIHPKHVCLKCYSTIRNILKRGTLTKLKVKQWVPHDSDHCLVCESVPLLKKGRRKPHNKHGGRPKATSTTTTWKREDSINVFHKSPPDTIPKKYQLTDFTNEYNPQIQFFTCSHCHNILRQPLTVTPCEHSFCLTCLLPCIEGKSEMKCPSCDCIIYVANINPSVTLNNMMQGLKVECSKKCGELFVVIDESGIAVHEEICDGSLTKSALETTPSTTAQSSSTTIADIFNLTDDSDIPQQVDDAVLHVIRRKLAKATNNKEISFATGGRPLVLTSTPKAIKSSSDVTKRHLRNRNKFIINQIESLAGSSTQSKIIHTGKLLKSFSIDARKEILLKANISPVEISPDAMVAMKVDMGVPWEKLKTMSRWLTTFNISPASQAKQRAVAKAWSGNDLIVENSPFTFPIKEVKGQYKICSAPWAYITDLPAHITQVLVSMKENNLYVNHDSMRNEVHVKIGGDHGGGSFKMTYQLCNIKKPNSKDNTTVFSLFEAKDYRSNLKIGLSRFTEQVDYLQSMKWQKQTVRVFICGDYEFLCAIYGITGANGRHNCLFCTITSQQMQVSVTERGKSPVRTLQSLAEDLEQFQKDGADIKKAKFYNNVIHDRLFNVPLTQVALPALHISLGTYLKFFNLLENQCYIIDMKIAASMAVDNKRINQSDFDNYVQNCRQVHNLEHAINDYENKIHLVHQAGAMAILRDPENEEIKNIYDPRIAHLTAKMNEKRDQMNELIAKHELKKSAGPCVNILDQTLCQLNVQRQAYHGKSFVGNHVHKMLKSVNIRALCNSIAKKVFDMGFAGTQIHQEAIEICTNFKMLFSKYSVCHNLINGCENVDADKLTTLEYAICELMSYYREKWPEETTTPKLHLLEDHATAFIKNWGAGFGFYGEQGAESIHSEFNNLFRTYCRMKPDSRRLYSIMKEHLTRVHPDVRKMRPVPKQRAKRKAED